MITKASPLTSAAAFAAVFFSLFVVLFSEACHTAGRTANPEALGANHAPLVRQIGKAEDSEPRPRIQKHFGNSLCEKIRLSSFPKIRLEVEALTHRAHLPVRDLYRLSLGQAKFLGDPSLLALGDGYLFTFKVDCDDASKKKRHSIALASELDLNLQARGFVYPLAITAAASSFFEAYEIEDLRLARWHDKVWGIVTSSAPFPGSPRQPFLLELQHHRHRWAVTSVARLSRPPEEVEAWEAYPPFQIIPELRANSLVPLSHPTSAAPQLFINKLWPSSQIAVPLAKRMGVPYQELEVVHNCDAHLEWQVETKGKPFAGSPALWLKDQQKYLGFFMAQDPNAANKTLHIRLSPYLLSSHSFCLTEVGKTALDLPLPSPVVPGPRLAHFSENSQIITPWGLVQNLNDQENSLLLSFAVNDAELFIADLDVKSLLASMENSDAKKMAKIAQKPQEQFVGAEKEVFDRFRREHPLAASLTTSPTRLPYLQPLLASLLDNPSLSAVYLTLPEFFGKKREPYILPAWLSSEKNPKLKILRPAVDLGPLSKMIFALRDLRRLGHFEAVLVSLDDDTVYPADTFNQLLRAVMLNPRSVAGGSSESLSFWGIHHNNAEHWRDGSNALVIEGFAAIAYPISLVDDELMEKIASSDPYCFVSDDLVISYVLDQSAVERIAVANAFFSLGKVPQLSFGFGADALHKGQGIKEKTAYNLEEIKYPKCNEYISRHYPPVPKRQTPVPIPRTSFQSP